MEQTEKTRKPWNKLLIVELLLPLVNCVGFFLFAMSEEGGWPSWCGVVGNVLLWGTGVLIAAGVLVLPFLIWKRRFFSLPLLIVAAVINAICAVLLVLFWSGELPAWLMLSGRS
jgi:hypothetical protein